MVEQNVNPFDDDNFVSGGGLWDGKTVTILDSKIEIDRLTFKDGSPVIDKNTGEPAVRHVWTIVGISDEDEKERRQTYSIGGLIPTPDGLGFTKADGTPGVLHKNSAAAKFASGLKQGGFDMGLLFPNGKPDVSGLRGARVVFKAVDRLDKDGKPKVNKNGYTETDFYPVQFVGFKQGVSKPGNGAVSDELKDFATETVTSIIVEAGGNITRADLIRQLTSKLAGDERGAKVVQLVLKPEFNVSAPWTVDGTTLSIGG